MREEFEKLPSVKKYLEYVFWNNEAQGYCNNSENLAPFDFASFINGGWYAYQEQQKKIEQILDIINTGLKIEHNMNNQIHSLKEKIDTAIEYLDSIEGLVWYEQIKDILK